MTNKKRADRVKVASVLVTIISVLVSLYVYFDAGDRVLSKEREAARMAMRWLESQRAESAYRDTLDIYRTERAAIVKQLGAVQASRDSAIAVLYDYETEIKRLRHELSTGPVHLDLDDAGQLHLFLRWAAGLE